MIPIGILKALAGVEAGIVVFSQAWSLIKNANAENRDLSLEEMASLDISLDQTDEDWQAARLRRQQRNQPE